MTGFTNELEASPIGGGPRTGQINWPSWARRPPWRGRHTLFGKVSRHPMSKVNVQRKSKNQNRDRGEGYQQPFHKTWHCPWDAIFFSFQNSMQSVPTRFWSRIRCPLETAVMPKISSTEKKLEIISECASKTLSFRKNATNPGLIQKPFIYSECRAFFLGGDSYLCQQA